MIDIRYINLTEFIIRSINIMIIFATLMINLNFQKFELFSFYNPNLTAILKYVQNARDSELCCLVGLYMG